MDMENQKIPETEGAAIPGAAVGAAQLKKWMKMLEEYKSAKARTDERIVSSEQWWKLRNTQEEQKQTEIGSDGGFTSVSGWLHNVITSKHADAMESFPEPNILPREEGDKPEAQMLSSIIPCILEQNNFEETYSEAMWQKLKTGTGLYKVVWDHNALGGLGEIRVECINLLNVFWEPGKKKIDSSKAIFQTELVDRDILIAQYPQLQGKLKNNSMVTARFLYDDTVKTTDKATVVDVYYKKAVGGRTVLHYCKFVGDQVLYATENETEPVTDPLGNVIAPAMAEAGLYDHGEYPFVFDPLFPIEGSPCGYGFVDLCKNPQLEIDLLKTAIVKNAQVGAIPRYMSSQNGNVNEEEFLDLSKPIVHVDGPVDEASLRRIEHSSLDGMYVNVLDRDVTELRETSGNTETATGSTSSGVTAASAIAALQEASGKGSRDSTMGSYRAYSRIVGLCIELIRQFYDLPRKFRIVGEMGSQQFVTYQNTGLRMQPQFGIDGQPMGMRKPVFDIKISAQKRNVYTKVANNEMAIQFFQMGFFQPAMAEQALICLEIMDFDGKEGIMQKIQQQAMMQQKLVYYAQQCMMMAQAMGNPMLAQQAAMDLQQLTGMAMMPQMAAASDPGARTDSTGQLQPKEHALVQKARERANNASQPSEG